MDSLCRGNHSLASIALSICCCRGRLWAQIQALLISQHFQFHQLSSWALKKISKITQKQRKACDGFTVSMAIPEKEVMLTSRRSWTLLSKPFMYGFGWFTKPFFHLLSCLILTADPCGRYYSLHLAYYETGLEKISGLTKVYIVC